MNSKILVASILALIFSGCDLGDKEADQKYEERLSIETQQLEQSEQRTRERLAVDMEKDLGKRQKLYTTLAGRFYGSFDLDGQKINVNVELLPTLAIVPAIGRVRTVEEIGVDLGKQGVIVRVALVEASTVALLASCPSGALQMDFTKGVMSWSIDSGSCNLSFNLLLDNGNPSVRGTAEESQRIVMQAMEGSRASINTLSLRFMPSVGDEEFFVSLKRRP